MFFLPEKTQKWVTAGLIDDAQAAAILKFERENGHFSAFGVFLSLGAFCVGLGVIALIAANWRVIPDGVKLAGMAVLLAGNALTAAKIQAAHPKIFESLLVLQAVLFLAAIGLTGQIFNLPENERAAALFWAALVAPLLMLTRSCVLFFVEIPLILFGADVFDRFVWKLLRGHYSVAVALTAVCILFAVYVCVQKMPRRTEAFKKAASFYALAGALFFLTVPNVSLPFLLQFVLLGGTAFYLLHVGKTGVFQVVAGIMALRVLIAFCDAFGGLFETGEGLIALGTFVSAAAWGGYKAKIALIKRFARGEKQ